MTGSDRERDVEALAAFLRTIPSKRETETFGQYDRRRARAILASDWLAEHEKAVADEALDRLSDRTRAKWEAEARYATLVDKVSALADEWFDEDAGIEHVAACQDFGCKTCVVIACGADLRALLEADQ